MGRLSDYRSSLELEQRPETYFNLALVLEEAGDMDGAMRSAQKASELGFRKAGEYLDYLKGRAKVPAQNAE